MFLMRFGEQKKCCFLFFLRIYATDYKSATIDETGYLMSSPAIFLFSISVFLGDFTNCQS